MGRREKRFNARSGVSLWRVQVGSERHGCFCIPRCCRRPSAYYRGADRHWKTMATLYPSIKAMESSAASRVFYLSAKTSTQALAQIALKDLTVAGGSLRSIVITSKEKTCFSPGQPCHPDHCEYAKGYYDQVQDTIDTMLGRLSILIGRQLNLQPGGTGSARSN